MVFSHSQMLNILLWFLCANALNLSTCNGNLNVGCHERDRHVLSIFKQSIKDPLKLLSSWSSGKDCCKWSGVQCDNITGRVTKLDLHSYCGFDPDIGRKCLGGKIDFSLLQLEFLSFLDLSNNDFKAICSPIIHGFANFSNLLHLDISENYDLYVENIRWVSHLSSLKYLNLSFVSLHKEINWLQWMSILPSLGELRLKNCDLSGGLPSSGYANFTSLVTLDLSCNSFDLNELSKWLFNLSSISYLDLSFTDLQGQIPKAILNLQNLKSLFLYGNHLNGSIPEWMGQYKQLEDLYLSANLFSGPIPETLGNISSLTHLYVSYNQLNGSLPMSLGKLSKLKTLRVAYNSLSGVLSEKTFPNLPNLKDLHLGKTEFLFDFASHWHPSFQLEKISMEFCMLGPEFPSWLYTQRSVHALYISSSGLSFFAKEKFWSFVAQIDYLDLSDNSISGDISNLVLHSSVIDLHSNKIRGELPHLSPKVGYFDMANNTLSGSISPLLCQITNRKFELEVLDLAHNFLSGELTDCWEYWQSLTHVNLGNNNLTGEIPHSMGSLFNLQTLRLHNNIFYGNIPPSLQSCKRLSLLDLRFNSFSGNLPSWPSKLTMALLLRANNFSGSIPPQICELSNLLVLDLAVNRLSGLIPECLGKISTMVADFGHDQHSFITEFDDWYLLPFTRNPRENIPLFVKGREFDYLNNFMFLRIVDLSDNDLSGPISPETFSLFALQSLNLSHNHLIGKISTNIGNMKYLESLDLSSNELSGEIPQTMSNLSFLNHLNLSYNNFVGKIPLGTQLQSFDASSYTGNSALCGAPLANNCTQEEEPNGLTLIEDNGDDFWFRFYIGMGAGFAIGFWGVCGPLFFIRKWRHAYFQFVDDIRAQFYVIISLKMNYLR